MEIRQLSSGDRGLEQRGVITASSASDLSKATGLEIPDSGSGVYLAAFWGERRTGGYSVRVESARVREEQVTIHLALREPPPGAFVTQALTYPYAVAFISGLNPEGKSFVLKENDGQELDWPVSEVG